MDRPHPADRGAARLGKVRALAGLAARRAVAPTGAAAAVGLLIAAAAMRALPDTRGDVVDAAAGWLRLPVLLATTVAIAVTIESQPALGRGRPDAEWVRRLRLGPLDGAGVAAAASLAVLALWLAIAGAVFEVAVRPGAARPVRAAVVLEPIGPPRADAADPDLELVAERPLAATSVELRPIATLGQSGEIPAPRLRIHVDGRDLGSYTLPPGGGLIRLPLAGDPLRRVDLTLEPDQPFVVILPDGAARALAPTAVSPALNAAAAAVAGVFAAAAALAFALLGRRRLEPAILQVGAFAIVLAGSASLWTPGPAAIDAYARDLLCWGSETTAAAWGVAIGVTTIIALAVIAGSRRPGGDAARALRVDPG